MELTSEQRRVDALALGFDRVESVGGPQAAQDRKAILNVERGEVIELASAEPPEF